MSAAPLLSAKSGGGRSFPEPASAQVPLSPCSAHLPAIPWGDIESIAHPSEENDLGADLGPPMESAEAKASEVIEDGRRRSVPNR
jgi:hypothetical protein